MLLQSQYYDFVSATGSLKMDFVKSNIDSPNRYICMDIFSPRRHDLSQNDVERDISSRYALKKNKFTT